MAGRPRKPTNVLELKGAFKHNPDRGRARANEPPAVGEIGDPPIHLSPEVAACWKEIVGLAHAGTLCASDRLIVEHGARVLNTLRTLPAYVDTNLMIRFEATLGKLGLTPADRSRVQIIKPKEQINPYKEFAQK